MILSWVARSFATSRYMKMQRGKDTQAICGVSWPVIFTAVAFIEAGTAIALEAYVFAEYQLWATPIIREVPVGFTVPTYLAVVLFGFVYEIFFIIDAMRLRNSIQIVAACLHNISLMIYLAIQRGQVVDILRSLPEQYNGAGETLVNTNIDEAAKLGPILLALPIIVGVGSLLLCLLAYKVTNTFSWSTWKRLHGDITLKRKLIVYQLYIVLLKYNFFVITAFLCVYSVTVYGPALAAVRYGAVEGVVNFAMIPVVLAILVSAAFCTKREIKLGMAVTILLFLAGLAYFVYKLIIIRRPGPDHYQFDASESQLTMYGVISLISLTATTINAIACAHNTGAGLKDYFYTPTVTRVEDVHVRYEKQDASSVNLLRYHPKPERLVLD